MSCRPDNLSWEHHNAEEILPPPEQKEWLDKVEKKCYYDISLVVLSSFNLLIAT